MPELPEVTVIVNSLNRKIRGLILESIEYDWPKKFFWGGYSIGDLQGAKVLGVERRGKVVIIQLSVVSSRLSDNSRSVSQLTRSVDSGQAGQVTDNKPGLELPYKPGLEDKNGKQKTDNRISILIHLKLTGQLIYQDAKTRIAGGHPIPPLNLPVPNKTTRATFTFTNKGRLYFNDVRKFGWVKIVSSVKDQVSRAIGAELGPDALEIRYEEFSDRLKKKPNARIKKLLMDQNFVAGIGNIYSDEALWRAKIHPGRSVVSLTDSEIKALFGGIGDSLKLAIEKGGSSARAFVDSGGEKGLYLSYARAYHMTGRPCARCKTPIVRKKMDGRSAHFCPRCQQLK